MVVSRRYRLVLEVGLLAVVAALAAFGVTAGMRLTLDPLAAVPAPSGDPTPGPNRTSPLDDYALIATRDLFGTDAGVAASGDGPLRLSGIGWYGGEARAVITDAATGRQDLYRTGDAVGGARIASIHWDHVVLARGGREETLEIAAHADAPGSEAAPADVASAPTAGTPSIRRLTANAFVVDRRELSGVVDNMSGLLTQLRAVAEVHDGRPTGFRLFQIRDDSLFRRLGLENGDVVQRVNGSRVEDPSALLGFLERLQAEPRVALDIVRAGAPRTMVYELR